MKSLLSLLLLFLSTLAWSQVATTPPVIWVPSLNDQVPVGVKKLLVQDEYCLKKFKYKREIPDLLKIRIRISISSSLTALENTSAYHCADDKQNSPYLSCLMTKDVKKELFVLLKKNPQSFDKYVKSEHHLTAKEAEELRGFYLNLCRK